MATSKDISLGYRTHVVGTAKPIIESKRIILYNKYQFASNSAYSRISVYNIERIYEVVSSSSLSLVLDKNPEDNKFHYQYSNSNTEGFNVIIYLSNFDNSPIGYTEFLRTQGKQRNINIIIDLQTTVEGDIEVNLRNSLAPLRNTGSIERVFVGENLWDFTSSNKIKSELDKITPISKYTTHLTSFNKDYSSKNIYLSNFLLRQNGEELELSKIDITRFIEADPYVRNFDHYQFSYYGDDLALYTWKDDGEYCIISLTSRNIFGTAYYYLRTDTASRVIPENYQIDYFGGHYIVCKDGTILDTLNNDSVVVQGKSGYTNIIDPLDPKSNIYELPPLVYDTVFQYLPELSNIYLDLKSYMRTYSLRVERKIGTWFILKRVLRGESLYILVNQYSRIYLTETDYHNLTIINNSVFMIEEDNYYLVYFPEQGEYWTERARSTRGGKLVMDSSLDVLFCTGEEEDELYRSYFNDGKIERVFKVYPIYDSILNLFRKNYYDIEENTIPNIVGACDGIIFFLTKDKLLKYL